MTVLTFKILKSFFSPHTSSMIITLADDSYRRYTQVLNSYKYIVYESYNPIVNGEILPVVEYIKVYRNRKSFFALKDHIKIYFPEDSAYSEDKYIKRKYDFDKGEMYYTY